MDKSYIGPLGAQAIDGLLTPMSGTVVHNQEDAMCGLVGLLAHDLTDEAINRGNPALGFASAEDLSSMDVPSSKVSPGALTKILVLDSNRTVGSQRQGWLFAAAGLNAGLFIRRDDEVVSSQGISVPNALVKVEDDTGLSSKVWIAGENPTAVLPRAKRVAGEPPPQRSTTDRCHETLSNHLLPDLSYREARQGKRKAMRKLASHRLNLNDEAGGKSGLSARPEAVPQGREVEKAKTSCATY